MYQPKRVLITGVCGFIASNVACYLVGKYPTIKFVGLDKMTYCSDIRNIQELNQVSNWNFEQCDLCCQQQVEALFEKHEFDTIMHFAAYSHVDYSFVKPLEYTQNNIVATHILMDIARQKGIQRFIHVSTDEVYGSLVDQQANEESCLNPTNPYSASKAAAEYLVRSYIQSFNFPAIITRGNNVYGPKQYPEKVISKFIRRLLDGKKCQIQGSGTQVRSFLYVDDVSRAFELLLFKGVVGEIYNIGTEDEFSILEVADRLHNLICPGNDGLVDYIADRNFNDQGYNISSAKIHQLGWKPEVDFNLGLQKTLDWYKEHLDWYRSIVE